MTRHAGLIAIAMALGLPSAVLAEDIKFVGTWEGFSQPIYTKLVFHDDGTLTYCSVQNCRSIRCEKPEFSGTLGASFEFSDGLRDWEFERTGPDEFNGLMSIRDGGMGFAVYTPESPGDRFNLMSLPAPVN